MFNLIKFVISMFKKKKIKLFLYEELNENIQKRVRYLNECFFDNDDEFMLWINTDTPLFTEYGANMCNLMDFFESQSLNKEYYFVNK